MRTVSAKLSLSVKKENDMSQIDTFEAMLSRGQDSDMLRFTLGNAYYKEKRYAEAAEHLAHAVELNPAYSTAWKILGRVLGDNGQLTEALNAFDAGLAAAKDNGDKQVEKEIGVFRKRVVKQQEKQQETLQESQHNTNDQADKQ